MSVYSGPEIVSDGLIFSYNMNNTQKSFIGPPTTNLLQSTDFTTGWQGYCGNTSNVTYNTLDITAPDGNNTALRHVRGAETGCGQGASWGLLHFLASPMIVGQPYTISVWGRTNGPSFNVTLGHNDSTGVGITLTPQWQRYSFTYTPGDTSRGFQFINSNLNTTTYWWRPQCEISNFATPFVTGTRTNTQAILDLTGNNTITANSLTYNSNGTFSFNGSNDKLTLGTTTLLSGAQNYTIDAVFRTSFVAGVDYIFGNYGTSPGANAGLEYYVFQNRLNNFISGNVQSATNLNADQWYISSVVRNGTTVTHYLNGEPDGSGTSTSSIATVNPFTIGNGHDYTSEAFGGTIAAVRVYNRALSAAEVQLNFFALRSLYGI